MIDRVSNLGFLEMQSPAVATSAGGTGTFTLVVTQAQGRVAFYMDAANNGAGGTLGVNLQTSPDNATWSNVGTPFAQVTNVANTQGVQAIFVDSAFLNAYTRTNATVTGGSNFTYSIVAVYAQKNA